LAKKNLCKIPKSFELLSNTIKVKYSSKLQQEKGAIGQSNFAENQLVIQKDTPASPISSDCQYHTYWHEVVHFLFYSAGEPELCANEKLVDLLGNLLAQHERTRKF